MRLKSRRILGGVVKVFALMFDQNSPKIFVSSNFEKMHFIDKFFGQIKYFKIVEFRAGVLKLRISPFLMDFEFLNLEFGNQIWKFMCSYFGKFFGNF